MYRGDDVLERSVPFDGDRPFVTWPIAMSALEALVDLGMSDRSIGRYFHVDPEAVALMRRDAEIRAA